MPEAATVDPCCSSRLGGTTNGYGFHPTAIFNLSDSALVQRESGCMCAIALRWEGCE
jgi:hypothetical protein